VILPQEALEELSDYPEVLHRPIQFRVTNPSQTAAKITHCGVLEFTAPANTVYMPLWLMNYLGVVDQSIVNFDRALLPKATYCKFQPQSSKFLDITSPKAVLENAFRRFACLTRGDIIAIQYNNQEYKFRVQETHPAPAVSIIDCDMTVSSEVKQLKLPIKIYQLTIIIYFLIRPTLPSLRITNRRHHQLKNLPQIRTKIIRRSHLKNRPPPSSKDLATA